MAEDLVYATAADEAIVIGGSTPQDSESLETGLRVETGVYNKAAVASVTILGDLAEGDELPIEIRGERVFTGTVKKPQNGVGDRQRLKAFDAIYELKNATVSKQYDTVPAGRVIQDTVGSVGVDVSIETESETAISPTFKETAVDAVVEKAAKLSNSVWYVDASNTLVFTDPSAVGDRRRVEKIRDASPGKRTPAYQSVRVVGNSPASRRGKEFDSLVASEPIVATAGDGDPTFEYEDDDINSKKQAQNVADSILTRLKRQQKGGFVDVVGRNDVRPFDVVELPESFGGESYQVSTVKHTITKSDGWKTKIGLGGLISA